MSARPGLTCALAALTAAGAGAARADDGVPAVVEANRAGLHRCWEKAAADDFRVAGRVILRLTTRGKRRVQVIEDTAGDRVLTDCVVAEARRWKLEGLPADAAEIEVPVTFQPVAAQYTVRAEDAPAHKPRGGKVETRVLLDAASTGAERASLVHLAVQARTEFPAHRHAGAEVVYVLDGSVRVRGLEPQRAGAVPTGSYGGASLGKGDAAYVPAGTAHSLLGTGGKVKPTRLLVLYAPPGPERPFKDPGAPRGDDTRVVPAGERANPAPGAPQPIVAAATTAKAHPIAGGKGRVRILLDPSATGDGAAYVGYLVADVDMAVPEHAHRVEAEILYVTAGRAELTVEGETMPVEAGMAVYLPPGKKHSLRVTSRSGLEAVQFYAPAGPEQRFKAAASAPGAR